MIREMVACGGLCICDSGVVTLTGSKFISRVSRPVVPYLGTWTV